MIKNIKRDAREKLDAPRTEKSILEQLIEFHELKLKLKLEHKHNIKKAKRKS